MSRFEITHGAPGSEYPDLPGSTSQTREPYAHETITYHREDLRPMAPPPTGPRERIRTPTGFTITDRAPYYEENGRTYQAYMPDKYYLPNDGEEQNRHDFQHTLYEILLDGKLAAAPIGYPRFVLDIGTGTGIWANEFAEKYPQSQVFGTDLSLIQPPPRTSNVSFVLEDSETQEWGFHDVQFDYVHLRSMLPCFRDVRTVIQNAYNHMSPGGWIEFQEIGGEILCDDDTHKGTAIERYASLLVEGGYRAGHDMRKTKHYKEYLVEMGFTDVREIQHPVPGGPWTQNKKMNLLGNFFGTSLWSGVDSYRKFMTFAGLSPPEIDALSEAVRQDLLNLDIHWYSMSYCVYGRKPSKGDIRFLVSPA